MLELRLAYMFQYHSKSKLLTLIFKKNLMASNGSLNSMTQCDIKQEYQNFFNRILMLFPFRTLVQTPNIKINRH